MLEMEGIYHSLRTKRSLGFLLEKEGVGLGRLIDKYLAKIYFRPSILVLLTHCTIPVLSFAFCQQTRHA